MSKKFFLKNRHVNQGGLALRFGVAKKNNNKEWKTTANNNNNNNNNNYYYNNKSLFLSLSNNILTPIN